MATSFTRRLDALTGWRGAMDGHVGGLKQFLRTHALLDARAADMLDGLRQRLQSERLVVACVAEFSRGKSELLNAIFFADTGRRVLPATPGRTTMCPVELGHEPGDAMLALLPIDTRLQPLTIDELRHRGDLWTRIRLDPGAPDQLAEALTEVMRTKVVTLREARALGFWNDERPDDNPPQVAEGLVEVPSWRHAVINYPHPLLERGLVLLDTPGLNAIGAEPELTLSLLPATHAVIFVVAADTGVTRSDLAIWRDHLGAQAMARYVVMNKIDMLADPLLTPDEVAAQIERQRASVAAALDIPVPQVFALSARQALSARLDSEHAKLAESRLPAFEAALADDLLPRRRDVLERLVLEGIDPLEVRLMRRLADARRQTAEQQNELRSLRGKSAAKVQVMQQRADQEAQDFERCGPRLAALRSVHSRILREVLSQLSSERLREEMARMQHELDGTLFHLGARRVFIALCQRLREHMSTATRRSQEIHAMLAASFKQLNSDFGFALALPDAPSIEKHIEELKQLERNYSSYLGLAKSLRLADPKFMEQFRRMLSTKLRALFEGSSADLELWNRAASGQVEAQLRERRQAFARRREALQRVATAAAELDSRLAEVDAQDAQHRRLQAELQGLFGALRERARQVPEPASAGEPARNETLRVPLRDVPTLTKVVPAHRATLA